MQEESVYGVRSCEYRTTVLDITNKWVASSTKVRTDLMRATCLRVHLAKREELQQVRLLLTFVHLWLRVLLYPVYP